MILIILYVGGAIALSTFMIYYKTTLPEQYDAALIQYSPPPAPRKKKTKKYSTSFHTEQQ